MGTKAPATPESLPLVIATTGPAIDYRPRCWRCGRVLIESAARPWHATCPRCKATNHSPVN